jgi:O-antigen/teichoic acid export membrane protein
MFVGSIGMFLREQGLNVIVNWMRGTAANAGRSIGHQLGAQTETLYNAFAMALNPEITRREGAGAHDKMLALAKRSERFGMIIMLLVGLPLFCECEYVLTLWLKNPPAYAVFFTRIQILIAILCKMRIGHMMCFQAIGKAKPQQLVDFAFYTATLLVVGGVYCMTRSLEMSFYSYVAFQVCYMVAYVIVGSRYFEWPLLTLLREIIIPSWMIFALGCGLFCGIECFWSEPSLARLIVSTLFLCVFAWLGSFAFILKREDRSVLINLLLKVLNRV